MFNLAHKEEPGACVKSSSVEQTMRWRAFPLYLFKKRKRKKKCWLQL